MPNAFRPIATLLLALSPACSASVAAKSTQNSVIPVTSNSSLTYADLADLSDAATVVARAEVRKVTRLKPEQAPGLPTGVARVLIEAKTTALLFGSGLGESIRYLADVPVDAKGGLPKLKKVQVIVFARAVAGRPGELRLVSPDAQVRWDPVQEQRVRRVLTELVAPDAAPRITALKEALHVPGNLAGEGETQLFLATENGAPVSLTVVRRPGQPPAWGVSLSEIVDQAARPPARETLTWYRLACFLPASLPGMAILSGSSDDRRSATEDYALVRADLGECPRSRAAR